VVEITLRKFVAVGIAAAIALLHVVLCGEFGWKTYPLLAVLMFLVVIIWYPEIGLMRATYNRELRRAIAETGAWMMLLVIGVAVIVRDVAALLGWLPKR
jgi:hypothetical protein